MRRRDTGRTVGEGAGLAAGQRDPPGDVMDRQRRFDDQHEGRGCKQCDRREILYRIVGQALEHGGVDGEGHHRRREQRVAVRGEQRGAVGRGLGGCCSRDHGAAARPVRHHEGPSQPLFQALRDKPRQQIGRAARRKRHHIGDSARRIILCPRLCHDEDTQAQKHSESSCNPHRPASAPPMRRFTLFGDHPVARALQRQWPTACGPRPLCARSRKIATGDSTKAMTANRRNTSM